MASNAAPTRVARRPAISRTSCCLRRLPASVLPALFEEGTASLADASSAFGCQCGKNWATGSRVRRRDDWIQPHEARLERDAGKRGPSENFITRGRASRAGVSARTGPGGSSHGRMCGKGRGIGRSSSSGNPRPAHWICARRPWIGGGSGSQHAGQPDREGDYRCAEYRRFPTHFLPSPNGIQRACD
jgi:hypothetical protein